MDREKQAETLLKSRLNVKTFNIPPYTALNEGKKRVKYFDSEGILCSSSLSDACGKIAGVYRREDGSLYTRIHYSELIGDNNINLFIKALTKLKLGDTYEDFIHICESTRYNIHPKLDWITRFVARIGPPTVEREPENKNPKTFDFVRIEVFLSDMQLDTLQEVKNHYNEIMAMVIRKIERSRSFTKYGVPVNCLKVAKATLTRQKVLEIVFELKDPATGSKETG